MIYQQPDAVEPITQGDILSHCPLLVWEKENSSEQLVPTEVEGQIVILTQACDMAYGKSSQVLVAVVNSARELVEAGIVNAKTVRDQMRAHRVYGWYFLPASGQMGESIVDLHNVHSVPRIMVEQLAQDGKRVCRISTPYREHLSQHFSTTYSRIGLPEPYTSEPG